jgi:uncharacterized protein YaiE (UPF0345 family)
MRKLSSIISLTSLFLALPFITLAFNPNNLIEDSVFQRTNSMTVNDIQLFLESRGSFLATVNPAYLGEGNNGRTAAQIIYDAARGTTSSGNGPAGYVYSNINPQVILTTLQKEQSLVGLSSYDAASDPEGRLRKAMGYGCPDSGGCDPAYAGFTQQIQNGTWQLQWNFNRSTLGYSDYQAGQTMTFTNTDPGRVKPDDSSATIPASQNVHLDNSATASLYRYTPHVYNGAYSFVSIFSSYFPTSGSVNQPIQKVGVLKNEGGDQNFYVYNAPRTIEPQNLTGYDLWNIPSGNNVVAVIGIDHDGDGKKSVGVLKNEGGDYNFYVYEGPQGPQAANIVAADYWNIPMFNSNTISICALDHNGDGRDEVGVLANENGDYNFYVFNAPRAFEATDVVAKDLWNIPMFNGNTVKMIGVDHNGDGRDEVGILANESGDYNFYIFESPQGTQATNIVARDLWNIPRFNGNTVAMTGIDVNGDGRDEIGVLANEGGDYNYYTFVAPIGTQAPPIIGADLWNIPSGNNGISLANISF